MEKFKNWRMVWKLHIRVVSRYSKRIKLSQSEIEKYFEKTKKSKR
ncbi:MAG: hypothetical protein PHY72_04250 [Candidatus Pacebacteria bacterium]|nr:hypothetical protein [Candidatus Paceibacterota bacterium]